MDRLPSFFSPPAPDAGLVVTPTAPRGGPIVSKGIGDYARAVRRRFGLVILVALAVIGPGAVYALRKPDNYRVEAGLLITPPQSDALLASLLAHQVGEDRRVQDLAYVPNAVALLKSRALAVATAQDPAIAQAAPAKANPVRDLLKNLNVRQLPGTETVVMHLDGTDPLWITKLLNGLANKLKDQLGQEVQVGLDKTLRDATDNVAKLARELERIDTQADLKLKESPFLDPSGESLLKLKATTAHALLTQERSNRTNLQSQLLMQELFPRPQGIGSTYRQQKLDTLYAAAEKYQTKLQDQRRVIRDFDSDPAVRTAAGRLQEIEAQIAAIEATPDREIAAQQASNPTDRIMAMTDRNVESLETEVGGLFTKMQEERPAQQQYLSLISERAAKSEALQLMAGKLANFELLAKSRRERSPVVIYQPATEPTEPTGPNRPLLLALAGILGLGLGLGLVCLLEHSDQSIRAPEPLANSLRVPVFGIIPWIVRNAANDRGGHLWTGAEPLSPGADAFRNLRASLLAEPITTLLVTSAKSGEGKSTTALNLALNCARAGERTLLMDVDLRRPTLPAAFPGSEAGPGLIDVLGGEISWQRAIHRSDMPFLDFLGTGDAVDVPVEVLGSREMRLLLESLSLHYDRVILDGPAVLGMADGRILGRAADAALLVVRAASHSLVPVRRAKEMLEQSRVRIAGVVLNALRDGRASWLGNHGEAPTLIGPRGPRPADDEAVVEDFAGATR